MGSSDTVLRLGFTSKYVDPERALTTIDFDAKSASRPTVVRDGPARLLKPPVSSFQLGDVKLNGTYECPFLGPRIALVLEGRLTAFTNHGSIHISRGQALFALAKEGPMSLRGQARVILAASGAGKTSGLRA
jgi:mannose-6-phosphate isomerase class I